MGKKGMRFEKYYRMDVRKENLTTVLRNLQANKKVTGISYIPAVLGDGFECPIWSVGVWYYGA